MNDNLIATEGRLNATHLSPERMIAMKISLVGPTYPFRGGISHYTTLLYRELSKTHEVQLLSFSRQYPQLLFPGKTDKDPSGVPLCAENANYCIDSMNPVTWLQAASKILSFQSELLILQWWVAFWALPFITINWIVKKESSTKVTYICHNAIDHESSHWKNIVNRLVFSAGDRIMTHSGQERDRLLKLLGSQANVIAAFHPTYASLCSEIPDPTQAKKQLRLHGNVLLFFGFVRDYKGLDILLQAIPIALKQRDVHLLIVGEFWHDKDKYDQMIRALGIDNSVRIVNAYIPNEEIGTYFSAADIVVQPYRAVSGSGVCQLAYGFGKPVIATRVGSLCEVIEDGINGCLVQPENPETLAGAIVECLEPKKLKQLSLGAAASRERFSWQRFVKIAASMT